jgi:hypothetical protein
METCSETEQFRYNVSKRLTTSDDLLGAGLAVLPLGRCKPLSSGTENRVKNGLGQGYNSTINPST